MAIKQLKDKKIELKDILLREYDGDAEDDKDFSKDEFNDVWQTLKKEDDK